MGTTPTYGFPFPDDTDLVIQAPQQFENLADAVDSALDTVETNSKNAGNLTSGTVPLARIPGLPASQITSGTLNTARLPPGFLYAGTRTYTANGSFAKADAFGNGTNIAARAVLVRVQGGGGGSGGTGATGSGESAEPGGGGGGGYAEGFYLATSLAASVAVNVGSAGAAGAAGDNAGGTGGQTSFAGVLFGNGGGGGSGQPGGSDQLTVGGGAVGAASGGYLNVPGEIGFAGTRIEALQRVRQNRGGSSVLGTGGYSHTSNAAGASGGGFGGGGGGNRRTENQSAQPGQAGAPGICIVDIFV